MKKLTCFALALALGSSSFLTSCETAAGTGALVGAAAGGAIGANTNSGGNSRTLVGAGIGALAGALVGSAIDENRRAHYGVNDRGEYPYATPTRYDGYVESPYAPRNVIDVRGIPRGELVIDPSVDRLFRNP